MKQTVTDIINKWQEVICTLDNLIGRSLPESDMFCIMIARKNQLIECVNDLKNLPKENIIPPNTCRKKILTKEQSDKVVCRDELARLNTGRRTGQRTSYYCNECKGWHTSTMTPITGNVPK